MTDIQWEEVYNTGVKEIDIQHRQLVRYVNDLNRAILQRNSQGTEQVIDELINYTRTHFAFEETLMKDANYEFFAAHQRVHELFTARVMRYKRRFDHDENVAPELYNLLKRWLINHIQHDDQNFASVVKRQREEANCENINSLAGLWRCFKRRLKRRSSHQTVS